MASGGPRAIGRLVLFGASGDLAGRYLLPALAALQGAGLLPEGFTVVGSAQEEWDDAAFRSFAAAELDRHAADVPAPAREALVGALRWRAADLTDPGAVAGALGGADSPVAAYLALPPPLFAPAIRALRAAGLPPGSRIAVEKPFGEDLEGAAELNRLLAAVARDAGERAAFRVDHFLGMASLQRILGLRLGNRLLEAVWDSRHVARVEVVWEETLALEGRAGYYDTAGQLRDMVQSHLLQVLCPLAMEPPAALGHRQLHDRRVEVLRAARPPAPATMAARSRRARYTAGRLGGASGRAVPAYAEEEGVDPARGTETFAEVVLEIDTPRWAGTPFVLRTGKALARDRMEAVVTFRPPAGGPFAGGAGAPAGELRIALAEPGEITLRLAGVTPGPALRPVMLDLRGVPAASGLPEYGRVLLDLLEGGSALSLRADEAEESWRVVAPVLEAWAEGRVPLEEYPAGSEGPPARGAGGGASPPAHGPR